MEGAWSHADLDCKVVNRTAIILFGRLPVPGKVKTRLAKTIGDGPACECYKGMCESVVRQAMRSTASVIFMCSEEAEVPLAKKWLEPFANPSWRKIAVRAQVEGNLGDRITAAFDQAFKDGCEEVIVAGTDVPDLTLDTFTLAFLHLQSFDVVIGPSEDDGYYLIGLHRKALQERSGDLVKKLFRGIHWSTSLVYRDQVSTAYKLELSVSPYKCLPVLIDVDTAVDARRWLERAAKQRHHPEQEDGRKEPSEIYASLAKALKFTPPQDSQWRRAAPKKLGGEGWASEIDGGGAGSVLSPSGILSALKRLASPPRRQDMPNIRVTNRTNLAKANGKKLTYH